MVFELDVNEVLDIMSIPWRIWGGQGDPGGGWFRPST